MAVYQIERYRCLAVLVSSYSSNRDLSHTLNDQNLEPSTPSTDQPDKPIRDAQANIPFPLHCFSPRSEPGY